MNNEFWSGAASRIPGFIRDNFLRKCIALIFATFVYITVMDSMNGENISEVTVQNIPVQIIPEPGKLIFQTRSQPNLYADVIVEAKKGIVLSPSLFSITRKISLDQFRNSEKIILSTHDVILNNPKVKVKIKDVHQKFDKIELEEIIRKRLPIKIDWSPNELPSGYRLKGTAGMLPPDQAFIEAEGPKRILSRINEISTEKIPLKNVTQDFSYTAKLLSPDKERILLPFDSVVVKVGIDAPEPREFAGLPIQVLSSSKLYGKNFSIELSPATARVILQGSRDLNHAISRESVHPFIDISGFEQPGDYTAAVRCWSDQNDVSVKMVHPDSIQVKIRPATTKTEKK